MLKQRCKIASKNVNFTIDDNERPLFIDNKSNKTPQEIKTAWTDKVFSGPWITCSYTESSVLSASINIEYTDLKQVRNTNYVLVEVHGETKYYFVTKVTIKRDTVATLTLYLDTVTTYLDNITFGNDMLVKRKHFDRYVKNTDGKYVINNSQESGIWNVEQDIPTQSFIPVDVQPINVLPDNVPKYITDNYWPVAIMKSHDYGELSDKLEYDSKVINNIPFFGSLWFLGNDNLRIRTHYKDGRTSDGELIDIKALGIRYAAYIQKVVGSPLPLWKQSDIKFEDSSGRDRFILELKNNIMFDNDDQDNYNGVLQPVFGLTYSGTNETHPAYVLAPSNIATNGLVNVSNANNIITTPYEYKTTLTLPSVVKHKYDSLTRNTKITDPKIFSSQHTKHIIASINGQHNELVNEYVFDDNKVDISIDHSLTTEGVIQFVRVEHPLYEIHNKDNSKTLAIGYKDQFPNPSDPYATWLSTNANQFKTAQANTRRSQKWGIISGLVGGAIGAGAAIATGGIGASIATKAALGAASLARGGVGAGQSMLGGALGGAGAVVQGRNRLAELQAKRLDVQNIGGTTELDDVSFLKDMAMMRHTNFGDSKLAFSTYMPTELQIKRLDSYYKKFGYECEVLDNVKDYSYFNNRINYSYFEVASIKTAIDKSSVPVEVLEDLNRVFGEGVRLWNVKEDGSVKVSDYETENWELPLYSELTN